MSKFRKPVSNGPINPSEYTVPNLTGGKSKKKGTPTETEPETTPIDPYKFKRVLTRLGAKNIIGESRMYSISDLKRMRRI